MHRLVIFDIDGTLAESKQSLSHEMALALAKLLATTPVAIVSGGGLPQFLKQIVARLPRHTHLEHLYLLPTSGAALYERKNNEWHKVYEERLTEKETAHITNEITEGIGATGIIDLSHPAYGERIENRGSQVTLSALGQQAPLSVKQSWDPDRAKRLRLYEWLTPRLPDYEVRVGGTTSIDVTKRGIDKAYGVHKLCARLGIDERDALYVGDQLSRGGNDAAVLTTAVATCAVTGPADTLRTITLLAAHHA